MSAGSLTMDLDCIRHFQAEDNEASQVTSVCLRTPLILRKIMDHFSDKELLKYTVINKQWNYEARSLMRLRGTFIARLKSPRTCRQLVTFAALVRQMNVVPFCGISIHPSEIDFQEHQQRRGPTKNPALDPAYNIILDRLQWKHFSVSFHDDWRKCSRYNCQAFLLAKNILQNFCEIFEVLELYAPRSPITSIESMFRDCNFPRLRTLHVHSSIVPLDDAQKILVKTVIARAPNLQELCLKGPVDLKENLLEGSSAVLVVDTPTDPLSYPICDDLIGRLRVKQMIVYFSRYSFSLERFDRIVPEVLQTSRIALTSLTLNLGLLVRLMCYGICLENVTVLTIWMSRRQMASLPPCMLRLVNSIDFTRIFPSLNNVAVYPCHDNFRYSDLGQIMEQGNAAWKEPPPDRAVNINRLDFTFYSTIPPFLASMFPQIEILEVKLAKGPTCPYDLIWEHWVDLKELHIRMEQSFLRRVRQPGEESSWCQNVDSLFCGIFPEEVAELREQDDEYLKTVNIVPIMAAITCMKALTTLRLILRGAGCFSGQNDPTFIFSKVTGFIAFARCPNLTVTIETHMEWEDALSHMKDYASFVYH